VDRLHALAIGLEPDLTFVLDMDAGVALARGLARGSGEDRFEGFGLGFQEQLRAGFRALAAEFPARVRLVDAARPSETIAAEIAASAATVLA